MNNLILSDISPDWARALEPVRLNLEALASFLKTEKEAGRNYLPEPNNVLRAFMYPLSEVKVLIVGQDPYPTPGHPIGLSFATSRSVLQLPRSLRNIYQELFDDLSIEPATHGDLSAWSEQGVMLLNRVLTVESSKAGSHLGKGWEAVTDRAISALVEREKPFAAILWGSKARELKSKLGNAHIIESAHPSPLSAYRGFFGSKPFSRTNKFLEGCGSPKIDWKLQN